jgi:hypothetical protein
MVELRQGNTKLRFSPTIWMMTLEMGRLSGWVPLGTRRQSIGTRSGADALESPLDYLPWQTDYTSSDGQTVTIRDANAFAQSLEKASTDSGRIIADWQQGRVKPQYVIRTPSTGFRWFSTPAGKEHLLSVAAFCRRGEFQIC